MIKRAFLHLVVIILALSSCAQTNGSQEKNELLKNRKTKENMDLTKITNEIVKSAIEALQANDKILWYSYFTKDAVFTDDGRTLDFKSFFDNAFDKKEKFLTIDKVENDGTHIFGNFYAGQWGTFNVYFKFTINAENKIERLDIGQGK